MAVLVEACVDTLAGAIAAERAGAARLELCAALADGGTTPSVGLIERVCEAVHVPVRVLVRVRGGDFVYAPDEVDVMSRDIAHALGAGAEGVVIGALLPSGEIDSETTLRLVDAAGESPVTFHRAIDFTPDPVAAIHNVAELGVATVLTSGGAQTALAGAGTIRRMVHAAAERMEIMAGGGVNEENATSVISAAGVSAVHVRCGTLRTGSSAARSPGIRLRKALPADEGAWEDSGEARIRQVVIAAAQPAR